MAQLKPVPAPRKKYTETVESPPPLPPKPALGGKLRDKIPSKLNLESNLDKPIPKPRLNIKRNVAFKDSVEVLTCEHITKNSELNYEKIPRKFNDPFTTSDLPPQLPPRPTVENKDFSTQLDELLRTNFNAFKNDYETFKEILEDKHTGEVDNTPLQNTTEVMKKKVAAVLPTVQENNVKDLSNAVFDSKRILEKFLESEMQYIKKLEEALEISQEFQLASCPKSTILKFFGSLKEIHKFHKEIFYKDLSSNLDNPKKMVSCFAKHASKFSVYIERQWLVPKQTDLTDFELFLMNERDLKEYVDMSKDRVTEYMKMLVYLKTCIQYDIFKDSNSYLTAINEATGIVENLFYQLKITEKLQSIENIRNKFKECGQVHLNNTFKVSIDGSKRNKYDVYFCENLIMFVTLTENGTCRYVDDIPLSQCYCCVLKDKPMIFEIGIKNKRRYILKADSKTTRDKWCEKLKQVLGPQIYDV